MVDGRRAFLVETCGGWPNRRGCRCQHTPYSMCLVGLLFQDNFDLCVASSCIAAERCSRMTGSQQVPDKVCMSHASVGLCMHSASGWRIRRCGVVGRLLFWYEFSLPFSN